MNTTAQTPMTQTVQELAVKYADALIQYHTAKLTEPRNRAQLIEAREQLFIVHERLDSNSIRAAEIAAGFAV